MGFTLRMEWDLLCVFAVAIGWSLLSLRDKQKKKEQP